MTSVVLDASVVLKWFRTEGERHVASALELRSSFEKGSLYVLAPPLLPLEIINVAGRRCRRDPAALAELAGALDEIGFELEEPDLQSVARWTGVGLTAYDAAYVAVAEAAAVELITDDAQIVKLADGIARPLAG